MNGLVGAKNSGLGGPTLEKRENEWISKNKLVGAKNRGHDGPTEGKKENKWISRG